MITAPTRRRLRSTAVAALALLASACGSTDSSADEAAENGAEPTEVEATGAETTPPAEGTLEGSLRLGFFPNVTHAPALVGVANGDFTEALGAGVELETFTFNAGTEATEALFAGAIDITFIGPNPAINAFAQSDGTAIRIISGSTSGGAYLVVDPAITTPEQLRGATLATPSLGNTQDVALRAWLGEHGLEAAPDGGGDVSILPQSNATTLEAFVTGAIDGAWVPEPWATRLVREGSGTVLVDERDLWPATGGEYVTTHVIVRTEYLEAHPDVVAAFLEGLLVSIESIEADPAGARAAVAAQIEAITGQATDDVVLAESFDHLTFTADPIAASLQGSADDAVAVGLLDPVDLTGIHDLTVLNELLAERGEQPVEGL